MQHRQSDHKANVVAEACSHVADGDIEAARAVIAARYPFEPFANAGRRYSTRQMLAVFVRDGFVDRYSGQRLVAGPALRLLSMIMGDDFPFHPNWRTDACHFAFWELSPTLDHVVPVSRGGADDESNWVTTSMLRNSAKANFTLDELGWELLSTGGDRWDGMMGWFVQQVEADIAKRQDAYLRKWALAAKDFELELGRLRQADEAN